MTASALKDRLRADLKSAMQARATGDVRLLRALIAALDNAEAVPAETGPYVSRAFSDPGNEVTRRELDPGAIDAMLGSEIASRLAAAADYERHARPAGAARLREEAALIARYRTN